MNLTRIGRPLATTLAIIVALPVVAGAFGFNRFITEASLEIGALLGFESLEAGARLT